MSDENGIAAVRRRTGWRPPPAAAPSAEEAPVAVVVTPPPEPVTRSAPAPTGPPSAPTGPAPAQALRSTQIPDPLAGLADEVATVQLTVRIRPSVERHLARCLHQLAEAGLRRPSRAEIVEAYLASLPTGAGRELEGLVVKLRDFRATAPRP